MSTYTKVNYINNIQDFEDFCKDQISPDDIKSYKLIISQLDEWCRNNSHNQENIRRNFAREYNRVYRQIKLPINKSRTNTIYREMISSGEIKENPVLKTLLQKKPSRNISGITNITLVMSPHPDGQSFSCKHDCFYCPNEPAHEGNNFQAQPRSYLYYEPAVKRANENGFKAHEQMISRMNTLYSNGHTIDKLEIILEGGTYTEYPAEYLERYHRDIFYAANTYFDETQPKREPLSIKEEIVINKTAKVHIIGICIETRPDAIDNIWIRRFRYWGVTRIQLGVQHTDNRILKKINRGHTIEQAIEAIEMLKDNCFKIDIHLMPDLPLSSPEIDKDMFDLVYTQIYPDQIKIYPCEVTPWTMIKKWHDEGKFTPYSEICMEDLVDVIKYAMMKCPEHIRLPRVVRDIPISYIEAGNPYSNLRQMIYDIFERENIESLEIRSREIGRHPEYYNKPAKYNTIKFDTPGGEEYFISYDSLDKKALFGFLRLRLVKKQKHEPVFKSIRDMALIRELHVYGNVNAVGAKSVDKRAQHNGIGKGLLKIAEKVAVENNYMGIVVISGEGVKNYYRNLGYIESETYMIKDLYFQLIINIIFQGINKLYKYINIFNIIFIIYLIYIIYSNLV